jgi:hypothetical protein
MPDLTHVVWCKSTRSGQNGNCVEVAPITGAVAVRDSKDPGGGALVFGYAEWVAFVEGVHAGRFDLT